MSGMEGRMKGDDAYKETSCFQTGLWEDMRETNMCADMPKGGCLVEPFEEEGEGRSISESIIDYTRS